MKLFTLLFLSLIIFSCEKDSEKITLLKPSDKTVYEFGDSINIEIDYNDKYNEKGFLDVISDTSSKSILYEQFSNRKNKFSFINQFNDTSLIKIQYGIYDEDLGKVMYENSIEITCLPQ